MSKTMIVNVPVEFQEDFSPGCCYDCPLAYDYEERDGYEKNCIFMVSYDECPLKNIKDFYK